MKRKKTNERAISLVNLILIIAILILCAVIIFIITGDITQNNSSEIAKIENTIASQNSLSTKNTIRQSRTAGESTNVNITDVDDTNISEKTKYKKYYYSQINPIAQEMYDALYNNIDLLKSNQKISFSVNEADAEKNFQTAWDAINLDKPEIFYLDTNKISLISQTATNLFGQNSYKYYIEPKDSTYYLDSWKTQAEVENAITSVETVGTKIAEAISGNSYTRYDKVKYIHDYIVSNVEYDETGKTNNSNIYGALIEGSAVCEGYAESFKYLADVVDVPCVTVYGDGINSAGEREYHSWNYVLMDDEKWYAVDTTFDDPIIIGNGELPKGSRYKYFLKGSNSFNSTHFEQPDVSGTGQKFVYPTISATDYNN